MFGISLRNKDLYFLWVIDKYLEHREKILACGADDIIFYLGVNYDSAGQCNLSFEPEILKKISELNIPLWISCWEVEEGSLGPVWPMVNLEDVS